MMAGKPLLVSSSAPLKRLVELHQSGLVFEAGNERDFAEKAKQLYTQPELQQKLGRAGLQATVQGELNWEHNQADLINLYQSLA
jgi:glycosyltransferase involved in cell wall biosynthesis